MANELALRCSCGALRGALHGISPGRGNRVVCYCDDCQSFAHVLGRAGEILDANGGTDIFQTSPARLEITSGAERLACLQLRPGGLLRWYASCCRTPLGNTARSAGLPFVGLIHACVDPASAGRTRDELFGPVRARAFVEFARGDRTRLPAARVPLATLLRFAALVLAARLRGEQRRSPFFDAKSGEPAAPPRVLGEAELREVERRRDSA